MLDDKVVVVTGGAGLIGRAFCAAIVRAGGRVVVADIDADAASRVAADIGAGALAATMNITEAASVDAVIDETTRRWGRIAAVVNNAYPRNKNYGRKLEQVTYSDFAENVSLHLGGYFLVSQRFALHFRDAGGGTIINMASIYGLIAPRFDVYAGTTMTTPVEYAAIKSGVVHLTKYFAQYFKDTGIRCNALAPGGILDRQPESFLEAYRSYCASKGMLEPDDLTGALLFILSDASRHMTGQTLTVDDGFTL